MLLNILYKRAACLKFFIFQTKLVIQFFFQPQEVILLQVKLYDKSVIYAFLVVTAGIFQKHFYKIPILLSQIRKTYLFKISEYSLYERWHFPCGKRHILLFVCTLTKLQSRMHMKNINFRRIFRRFWTSERFNITPLTKVKDGTEPGTLECKSIFAPQWDALQSHFLIFTYNLEYMQLQNFFSEICQKFEIMLINIDIGRIGFGIS